MKQNKEKFYITSAVMLRNIVPVILFQNWDNLSHHLNFDHIATDERAQRLLEILVFYIK
jgi:hypothetical protein